MTIKKKIWPLSIDFPELKALGEAVERATGSKRCSICGYFKCQCPHIENPAIQEADIKNRVIVDEDDGAYED